ncbi:MAG: hypothetical protein WBB01_03760 [Phormidesmis sp.]
MLALSQAKPDARFYRTNPLVEPPFKNPPDSSLTEIEVTDPMHPLFGRRFQVLYIGKPSPGKAYVAASYRGDMRLRIPLSATQAVPGQPRLGIKLTMESVSEFVTLIENWEALCPSPQKQSGSDSAQS